MTSIASVGDVTELLRAWSQGEQQAEERLIAIVYGELSRIAARLLSLERRNHTLEPHALVNEAYLRLVNQERVHWQNRAHFFALAARMMRRVLLDHAKAHRRAKRGGGLRVAWSWESAHAAPAEASLSEVDDLLRDLSKVRPRLSSIVELRFFGGLSVAETAEVLGRSPRSIARDWRLAKAWMMRELTGRKPLEDRLDRD